MHEETKLTPAEIEELKTHKYEKRDVNIKGLRKTGIYFFAFAAFSAFLTWGIFKFLNPEEFSVRLNRSETAYFPKDKPYLQGNIAAKEDIKSLREKGTKILNSYKWIDQKKQIARIPIDRAMEITLEKGLFIKENNSLMNTDHLNSNNIQKNNDFNTQTEKDGR